MNSITFNNGLTYEANWVETSHIVHDNYRRKTLIFKFPVSQNQTIPDILACVKTNQALDQITSLKQENGASDIFENYSVLISMHIEEEGEPLTETLTLTVGQLSNIELQLKALGITGV